MFPQREEVWSSPLRALGIIYPRPPIIFRHLRAVPGMIFQEKTFFGSWILSLGTPISSTLMSSTHTQCPCPCHPKNPGTCSSCKPNSSGRKKKKHNFKKAPQISVEQDHPADRRIDRATWLSSQPTLEGKSFRDSITTFCGIDAASKSACSKCVGKWQRWLKKEHKPAFLEYKNPRYFERTTHQRIVIFV